MAFKIVIPKRTMNLNDVISCYCVLLCTKIILEWPFIFNNAVARRHIGKFIVAFPL